MSEESKTHLTDAEEARYLGCNSELGQAWAFARDLELRLAEAEKERDELIPLDPRFVFFNAGAASQCDALIGPCACGVWHKVEDIQERFAKLYTAQQTALEIYVQKLDATQQARDAAQAFTEECRKEWADMAIRLRAELTAQTAAAQAMEDALKEISKQRNNRFESTVTVVCNIADAALAKAKEAK